MKRDELLRLLHALGAKKIREGKHTIYQTKHGKIVVVPKGSPINKWTAKAILKDAEG